MVDPVIGAAAIGLISTWGGKVLDRLLEDGEERAVAVDARGELHAFTPVQTTPTTVSLALPSLYGGYAFPPVTEFVTQFVPADTQAASWLNDEQPMLLIVEDEDDDSELSAVGLATELGAPTPMQLPPGNYSLAALVFLDESLDDIDGFGYAEFSISPGEPEFGLLVSVDSDADGLVSHALLGFAGSRCRAVTRSGERCLNHLGESFLLVCNSHGQAIEGGSTFVDALRGVEIEEDEIEVPAELFGAAY